MKLEEIKINGLGETIVVGVIQLKSPFDDEITKSWSPGKECVFSITEKTKEAYRKRIKKIENIFKKIGDEKAIKNIDLLVFPEYSFLKEDKAIIDGEKNTIQMFKDFSKKNKTIVIGNYYDDITRSSVSFVTLPEGYAPKPIYTAIKQTVSTYDKDVLKPPDKISEEDKKILKFWWTPDNNRKDYKAYFQILTCKDYLYFTSVPQLREHPDIIDVEHHGLIISPMSTPKIRDFESMAISLMRETGEKSIVSILCNATSVPKQEDNTICGQSQIVSLIDMKTEVKPLIKRGTEGIIIATINPFKSIKKLTPVNEREANAVILSSKIYEISESENDTINITEIYTKRKGSGFIVHPKALREIELRKIYGYLRLGNYHEIKEKIQKRFKRFKDISIATHGIYGIHDILCFSYEKFGDDEEAKELLKSRLWPIIIDKQYFEKSHFGYAIVDETIKYHGIDLKEHECKSIGQIFEKEEEIKPVLRRVLLGEKVDGRIINDLKKHKILIETDFDTSDISVKEKNDGMLEFLVCVLVLPGDKGRPDAENECDKFEEYCLPHLISDERVRTIEKIHTDGSGFVVGNYILHIVGDLNDLNDIVIGKIHGRIYSSDAHKYFKCGTRLIIPAEFISQNNYPAIMENKSQGFVESQNILILDSWKKLETTNDKMMERIVPSIIYLLDEKIRDRIRSVYYHAEKLKKEYKDLENNENWMKNMWYFTYGVAAAIGGPRIGLNMKEDQIRPYYEQFESEIGKEMEKELNRMFICISKKHNIPTETIEAIVNKMIMVVKKKKGEFSIDKIDLGKAEYALESLNAIANEYLFYIDTDIGKIVEGLNNKDTIVQELKDVFQQNNIPLSDDAKIEKIEDNNKWKIMNYLIKKDADADKLNIYAISKKNNYKKEIKQEFEKMFENNETKVNQWMEYLDIICNETFNVITKSMLNNGIKRFRESRNKAAHFSKHEPIYHEKRLEATYGGLKFLVEINNRMKNMECYFT